jgi:hypothetical protein
MCQLLDSRFNWARAIILDGQNFGQRRRFCKGGLDHWRLDVTLLCLAGLDSLAPKKEPGRAAGSLSAAHNISQKKAGQPVFIALYVGRLHAASHI